MGEDTKIRLAKDFYTTPFKKKTQNLMNDFICKLKDGMKTILSIIEIRRQVYLREISGKEIRVWTLFYMSQAS